MSSKFHRLDPENVRQKRTKGEKQREREREREKERKEACLIYGENVKA